MPIAIVVETQGTFGAIDKLPNGSAVLVSFDYSVGAVPELDPPRTGVVHSLPEKEPENCCRGFRAWWTPFAAAESGLTMLAKYIHA